MGAETVNAIGSIAAVAVAIVSLLTSLRRATQAQTDKDISAIATQVHALEVDIARNYVTKPQIDKQITEVTDRLERSMRDLTEKFDKLNEYLMRKERGL